MKNIRKYNKEFKLEAIKHYETSGKKIGVVAKNLGIPPSTLRGWVEDYQKNGEESFTGSGNIKPCNAEYLRLTKELKEMTMERDILKKALAIFSQQKK